MNPEFLDVDDVLELHALQIAAHGGSAGLRDRALLESAVAQPMAKFGDEFLHQDLFEMAAALLYSLASESPVCGWKQANRAVGGDHISRPQWLFDRQTLSQIGRHHSRSRRQPICTQGPGRDGASRSGDGRWLIGPGLIKKMLSETDSLISSDRGRDPTSSPHKPFRRRSSPTTIRFGCLIAPVT